METLYTYSSEERTETTEPPTAPRLTDEQAAAINEWAFYAGKRRAQAQGERFSPACFCAGVMTALFACQSQDRIPAAFVFGTLAGEDIFNPDALDRDERAAERQAILDAIHGLFEDYLGSDDENDD